MGDKEASKMEGVDEEVDFVPRALSTAKYLLAPSVVIEAKTKEIWDAASRKVVTIAEPDPARDRDLTCPKQYLRDYCPWSDKPYCMWSENPVKSCSRDSSPSPQPSAARRRSSKLLVEQPGSTSPGACSSPQPMLTDDRSARRGSTIDLQQQHQQWRAQHGFATVAGATAEPSSARPKTGNKTRSVSMTVLEQQQQDRLAQLAANAGGYGKGPHGKPRHGSLPVSQELESRFTRFVSVVAPTATSGDEVSSPQQYKKRESIDWQGSASQTDSRRSKSYKGLNIEASQQQVASPTAVGTTSGRFTPDMLSKSIGSKSIGSQKEQLQSAAGTGSGRFTPDMVGKGLGSSAAGAASGRYTPDMLSKSVGSKSISSQKEQVQSPAGTTSGRFTPDMLSKSVGSKSIGGQQKEQQYSAFSLASVGRRGAAADAAVTAAAGGRATPVPKYGKDDSPDDRYYHKAKTTPLRLPSMESELQDYEGTTDRFGRSKTVDLKGMGVSRLGSESLSSVTKSLNSPSMSSPSNALPGNNSGLDRAESGSGEGFDFRKLMPQFTRVQRRPLKRDDSKSSNDSFWSKSSRRGLEREESSSFGLSFRRLVPQISKIDRRALQHEGEADCTAYDGVLDSSITQILSQAQLTAALKSRA